MPLPDDEKIIALSNNLLKEFDAIFGFHPGFRPAHAKGQMLTGTFTPTPAAATLSRAPHFNRPSTPVTARFSDGTGIPLPTPVHGVLRFASTSQNTSTPTSSPTPPMRSPRTPATNSSSFSALSPPAVPPRPRLRPWNNSSLPIPRLSPSSKRPNRHPPALREKISSA